MEPDASNSLFCFGYGYTADHLGLHLAQAGWSLAGTTRDPAKRSAMRQKDIKGYIFDYDQPLDDARLFLDGVTHLLISTPPNDRGDPAFNMHAEDILQIPSIRWVGYLSSTAVYGDRLGGWVDESAELRPTSKRGSRRALAERQWRSLYEEYKLPVHIFRLAGIYGPFRSALDSVRAGVARRINKPGHAFSRIHIDDIVQVLAASMNNPRPGAIYNVADDQAAPSHELIQYACDLLNLEAPPLLNYEQADMAPITRSFYADNKRVRNNRIKDELGVTLRYPDYVSGIDACMEAERNPRDMLPASAADE